MASLRHDEDLERKVRNYDQYSQQIIEESTKSSHIYPNTQISPNLPSRSLSLREDSVFLPKAPNPIPENNIKPVFFASISSTPVHPPLPNQLVTDLNL